MRYGVQHGLNGGYLYIFISHLSAWLIIGKGALWRSKIPTDVVGPGFNGSIIVDTVSEAVTTGLNICEFLMKK